MKYGPGFAITKQTGSAATNGPGVALLRSRMICQDTFPGTENADIATSGSGGDRTPLIRPAERLELGAYSSDTGK